MLALSEGKVQGRGWGMHAAAVLCTIVTEVVTMGGIYAAVLAPSSPRCRVTIGGTSPGPKPMMVLAGILESEHLAQR